MSAVQLEQPVNSPIYDAGQGFTAVDKLLRIGINFLRSPTAAVIESALLMFLIGWIDYKTTDFAITVFYFGPVVLATWRAGRKAGWFIAALCGATVLIADLMVPRSGRVIALPYINAGILILASAALAGGPGRNSARGGTGGGFRAARHSRQRRLFLDDHARARSVRLGPSLPVELAHQRRQWNQSAATAQIRPRSRR